MFWTRRHRRSQPSHSYVRFPGCHCVPHLSPWRNGKERPRLALSRGGQEHSPVAAHRPIRGCSAPVLQREREDTPLPSERLTQGLCRGGIAQGVLPLNDRNSFFHRQLRMVFLKMSRLPPLSRPTAGGVKRTVQSTQARKDFDGRSAEPAQRKGVRRWTGLPCFGVLQPCCSLARRPARWREQNPVASRRRACLP